MKTSCPLRLMLAPFRATFGLLGQNVRPSWASGTCHLAHNCLPKPPKARDDVMGVLDDVMGLPRPMSWWKGHKPPGYGSAKLPLVERPPLLRCKPSDLSLILNISVLHL